jgi:hypothetical protein
MSDSKEIKKLIFRNSLLQIGAIALLFGLILFVGFKYNDFKLIYYRNNFQKSSEGKKKEIIRWVSEKADLNDFSIRLLDQLNSDKIKADYYRILHEEGFIRFKFFSRRRYHDDLNIAASNVIDNSVLQELCFYAFINLENEQQIESALVFLTNTEITLDYDLICETVLNGYKNRKFWGEMDGYVARLIGSACPENRSIDSMIYRLMSNKDDAIWLRLIYSLAMFCNENISKKDDIKQAILDTYPLAIKFSLQRDLDLALSSFNWSKEDEELQEVFNKLEDLKLRRDLYRLMIRHGGLNQQRIESDMLKEVISNIGLIAEIRKGYQFYDEEWIAKVIAQIYKKEKMLHQDMIFCITKMKIDRVKWILDEEEVLRYDEVYLKASKMYRKDDWKGMLALIEKHEARRKYDYINRELLEYVKLFGAEINIEDLIKLKNKLETEESKEMFQSYINDLRSLPK